MNRTRLFALALLLATGCHHHPKPSPIYAQARADFGQLYAQELDDAYLDPRMADIEAALKTVPKDSADADAAAKLLKQIQDGRAQAEAERDRTQRAVDEALAPPVMEGGAEEHAEPQDAGPQAPSYPSAGMSLAEFQKTFGDCFHPAGQATVAGDAGTVASLYALSETPECEQRYPFFKDRMVVADSTHVIGKALKSAYQPPPDAGAPEPVDAGTPRAADAGAPHAG